MPGPHAQILSTIDLRKSVYSDVLHIITVVSAMEMESCAQCTMHTDLCKSSDGNIWTCEVLLANFTEYKIYNSLHLQDNIKLCLK